MLESLISWLGNRVLRLGARIHLAIAIVALVVILADVLTYKSFEKVSGGFFDTLITLRPTASAPDARIVIIDIDEGSLSEIGKQYGRWPWPNSVFADLLKTLEKYHTNQVVFDILFSDRDVLRPQSDKLFNDAVADIGKRVLIYFPMVRLSPANDEKSKIPTGALPGARQTDNKGSPTSTMAVILPQVPAALEQGNLAFLNVYPDRDGVIRHYPFNLVHQGWKFDSYAMQIGESLAQEKTGMPNEHFLLNWRGPPFSYRYISIKDLLYAKSNDESLRKLLKGATVIIGSTAPALQDLKATPVATPFPGVEILATAVDNIANKDYIQRAPAWVSGTAASGFVIILGYLFIRAFKPDQINLIFLGMQVILIGLAWFALSYFNYFLNFSGAVTYGAAFFAIAKISTLQLLPLGREALFRKIKESKPSHALVIALAIDEVPTKNLRYFNESLIFEGQARGITLSSVLEPDDDAGVFGPSFHQSLVFAQFLSAKEADGALLERIRAETLGLILSQLDRCSPKSRVYANAINLIEVSENARNNYSTLGTDLYSAGIQSLSLARSL